ncbi:MAG TPA: folate-binding protein [Rhodocyclaceae bacterium]|nr:folate-binding protein [Rhodocyclaceae bacterium]
MNPHWTEFLSREGAVIDGHTIRFGTESRAGEQTIAVPLVHLGLIRSTGADSAVFLHNLFSNDVKALAADAAQWNSFNSPKGRMLASFLIWSEADGHRLALSADIQPAMLKKLSMYVLRSKVKLEDASADTALIGVSGAHAAQALEAAGFGVPASAMHQLSDGEARCIRLNDDSFIIAVPAAEAAQRWQALVGAGAAPAGTAAWQLAMIRSGLPLITAATQEEFVAQMLNYELIGGVSFNKGCYPGQEIVARTQYLGKLKKRMYRVHVAADEAPQPGTDVFTAQFGEQSAGKVVNVAPAPDGGFEALIVLQTSCAEAGDAHLGSPGGPRLSFLSLPYAVS